MAAPLYSPDDLEALRYTTELGVGDASATTFPHASASAQLTRRNAVCVPFPAAHNCRSAMVFAHYRAGTTCPQFVAQGSDGVARWLRGTETCAMLRAEGGLREAARYGRTVACFNLYPATETDVRMNALIWKVAQEGEYDPAEGNLLLRNNVLALSMPQEFFSFLRSVSKEELRRSMLEVLALIAEDEDAEGLSLMKSELEATIWQQIVEYMENVDGVASRVNVQTEHGAKLVKDVESLLRFCSYSAWKIDVYASYISPHDLHIWMQKAQGASETPSYSWDRRLVRSHGRRPIPSAMRIGRLSSSKFGSSFRSRMFWKLFQDWRRYRKVLVTLLAVPPHEVVALMLHSISQQTRDAAWTAAETVLMCSCEDGNLFSTLPRELVFNTLAPLVLYASSRP